MKLTKKEILTEAIKDSRKSRYPLSLSAVAEGIENAFSCEELRILCLKLKEYDDVRR